MNKIPNPFRSPGAMLYTVRALLRQDPVTVLAALGGLGIEEVEFFGLDDFSREDERVFGLGATGFKKALGDAGLNMSIAHIGPDWTNTASIASAAIDLGIDTVILGIPEEFFEIRDNGFHTVPAKSHDQLDRLAERLNRVGREYNDLGLTFGYHNHHIEFVLMNDQVPMDYLLEKTDPELVKLELDVGWLAAAGVDPVAYMRRHKHRIISCHLKDFDRQVALSVVPTFLEYQKKALLEPGAGTIDFKRVLHAMNEIGVEHAFIEIDLADDPLGAIERGHQYLSRL